MASAALPLTPPDSGRATPAGIAANGQTLAGETDAELWWDDVTLPSGDGQPGGDALVSFRVASAVPAATARFSAFLVLAVAGAAALRRRGRRAP